MQELRITIKASVPIDDGDAFSMATALVDAKAACDGFAGLMRGRVDVTSKLVTPRRPPPAEEDLLAAVEPISGNPYGLDITTEPAPVAEVAAADQPAVSDDTPITNIRTAPWRRGRQET